MSDVVEELWNIFLYYSLHGNPTDPSHLDAPHFYKLCHDSHMVLRDNKDHPIIDELKIVCISEVKKRVLGHQQINRKGLSFDEFISCLVSFSPRCYPECKNLEDSFLHLLMDNVLPFARRRFHVFTNELMNQEKFDSLFTFYESSFFRIFKYYYTSGQDQRKDKRMLNSSIQNPKCKSYDEVKTTDRNDVQSVILNTMSVRAIHTTNPNSISSSSIKISYSDFLRFANDYGLITRLHLSTMDLGDIYLNFTPAPQHHTLITNPNYYFNNSSDDQSEADCGASVCSMPSISAHSSGDIEINEELPRMRFSKFLEAILLCALTAFREYKEVSPPNKLQAMIQIMGKHEEEANLQQLQNRWLRDSYGKDSRGRGGGQGGSYLKGQATQSLNEKFNLAWAQDGYCDYLGSKTVTAQQGWVMLKNMAAQRPSDNDEDEDESVPESDAPDTEEVTRALPKKQLHQFQQRVQKPFSKKATLSRPSLSPSTSFSSESMSSSSNANAAPTFQTSTSSSSLLMSSPSKSVRTLDKLHRLLQRKPNTTQLLENAIREAGLNGRLQVNDILTEENHQTSRK